MYKNHQPDKLKNVPVVAKQYAGKERELVGLLKGKYGALSVKRLEENLEVLERTHRNRGGKSAAKKRGCFMLTVSLMFWLWVLLYFSFGAVFVSFVVLNAWECRALDNDEQELESSEECVPLKKELETFTYERVADYMSQSHPDACFCSEWKARENALFTNLSGDDLLNLVRLVPFSPDLFGSAWIATVKEQVPSQESYDNYAKPVVDLSLDVGSFVWSSVLELTRYDEASEEKSPIVEEDIADIPSLNEESESNAHTDSPDRAADEMEKEMENESFVNEVEAEDKVTDELYAEEVVVPPEEVPVEVDTFKFDDEPQTGDIEIATKEDMPEEDIIPVDKESAAIKEETFPFTSEAEDDVTSESTDVVESDDPPAIEESEDIPLAKEAALDDTNDVEAEPEDANVESADVYNTEVIETLTVDDAVFASVEETESVNANVEPADVDMAEVTETTPKDDSVLAPVTETEFVDSDDDEFSASTKADAVNAMVDVVEEASDATVEDADNTESLDEENAMESDDVVEVEVLQEGVDLSYTETVSDTNQEELTAESIEIFSSALEDELEPVDIEEDASSELSEAEAEKPVESENVAVESPESETDSAEDTVIIPSIADTVVEVKELSSDADVLTEATDGEMERAEEESVRSEELELNVEPDLNEEEPDTVVVSVDVDEAPVVQSENGDEVASTLSEENEVEVENNELDVVVEVEVETTANNDEGEMSASDEDHGDEEVIVELDSELPSSSNDVDVVEPLSEEGSVGVSNEGAEVANDVSNDEEPVAAPVAVVESLSEDADVKSDEEDAEENGSAIPVEVEASVPQLDLEEVVATVADETVVHELEEALENEASEQKEDLEEGLSASAEIESVVVEGDEEDAVPDSFFENDVESVEVVLDEEADGDAEASTFSAVEEEQSASEVGEFSEQGEESVVIEATEASIEADTDAPDATEDGTEEIEDVENAAFAATEDVETLAGDDTESAIVAEEELPDAVDEAFAVPADEEALEAIDEPAAEDVPELEEAPVIEEPIASIESADEHADITDETEPRQATDESSTTASEEEESGGLASAVNEVLARLVEPFEAAKTAAPEVATEEELA
ncbi:hypothetical protein L916_02030 [Phytophthora nicotianae]|uniref:Uncharacterized protein n=1 Tax=Phytophthora nicotianae TaxID=4792 RepID=W2JPL9_PHYNI|nr:hypothetical protein L916_02030 [Phytophthora nicotianae]